MAEWTKEQSDQITSLYGELKGNYEKVANQKLFRGEQLPYEEAHYTLMEILKKQEAEQHSGLEAKTNAAHAEKSARGLFGLPSLNRAQAAVGLLAIVLGLGMLSSFGAAAPLAAGYKVAAYSAAIY